MHLVVANKSSQGNGGCDSTNIDSRKVPNAEYSPTSEWEKELDRYCAKCSKAQRKKQRERRSERRNYVCRCHKLNNAPSEVKQCDREEGVESGGEQVRQERTTEQCPSIRMQELPEFFQCPLLRIVKKTNNNGNKTNDGRRTMQRFPYRKRAD